MPAYNTSLQQKEEKSGEIELEDNNIGQDRTTDNFMRDDEGSDAKDGDFDPKPSFERNLLTIERDLQKLEKKFLMEDQDMDMAVQWRLGEHSTHSYFLDTVTNFRP